MSPPAPPPDPAGDAASPGRPLSGAAIDGILADFRAWLVEAAAVAPEPPPAVAVDWEAVLGQWTALRHEVNLQTRASRALMEQNAQALAALTAPPAEDAAGPLLKTLIDLHDALTLARREAQRLADAPAPAVLPAWARWLGLGKSVDAALAPQRQRVDALLVGYTMSVGRVERALQQAGLEAIDCVGRPFDPERMEAVAVERDPGRPSTEVLEEVRRGYLRQGRVVRFAQVRVARP